MNTTDRQIQWELSTFYNYEKLIEFTFKRFILVLNIFCCIQPYYQILFNNFSDIITNFIVKYKQFIIFLSRKAYIQFYQNLFYIQYALTFKNIIHKGIIHNFRITFVAIKIFKTFKTFFAKKNIIRYYY